jgi:hypothetical protein
MKSVLILYSCYDVNTAFTAQWAANLRDSLVKRPNTICLLYDGAALCRAGTAFDEAVDRVDYIVFYGHGTKDEWLALPELASAVPPVAARALVDATTVTMLKEKKVYAGCCWSLRGLGRAHVKNSSQAEFVGYDQEFDFEHQNAQYFEEVVKRSVISYVNGTPARQVAADLQAEWAVLRDSFAHGSLKYQPNSQGALAAAERNRQRAGSLP